mmetsp:Transcript_3319/g.8026  ORF Transcript_3319/g.8026 Transcript_3319/m.8026 type:complete len:280 (+) Transcript_3319:366-1205(+)
MTRIPPGATPWIRSFLVRLVTSWGPLRRRRSSQPLVLLLASSLRSWAAARCPAEPPRTCEPVTLRRRRTRPAGSERRPSTSAIWGIPSMAPRQGQLSSCEPVKTLASTLSTRDVRRLTSAPSTATAPSMGPARACSRGTSASATRGTAAPRRKMDLTPAWRSTSAWPGKATTSAASPRAWASAWTRSTPTSASATPGLNPSSLPSASSRSVPASSAATSRRSPTPPPPPPRGPRPSSRLWRRTPASRGSRWMPRPPGTWASRWSAWRAGSSASSSSVSG